MGAKNELDLLDERKKRKKEEVIALILFHHCTKITRIRSHILPYQDRFVSYVCEDSKMVIFVDYPVL